MSNKKYLFYFAFVVLLIPGIVNSQWELLNGPAGGGGFIISPKPGTFFISTGLGIYRSTDNTSSWQSCNNGVSYFFRDNVRAIDGKDNTVLFGTNGHVIGSSSVYLTTDCGDTWEEIRSGRRVNSILFFDNYIFYTCSAGPGGDEGVFRSSDNGAGWDNIISSNSPGFLGKKDNYIFYSVSDSLFRSTDYGNTWELINQITQGYIFSNSSYLFISAGSKIYKSTDYGFSWDTIDAGFGIRNIIANGNNFFAVYNWDYTLRRSTDLGITWDKLYTNNVKSFGLCVSGNAVYSANDGVLRSFDNGNTWSFRNTGLTTLSVNKLFANDSHIFAATGDGMSFSTNDGQTWSIVYDTLVKGIPRSFANIDDAYFCATNIGLFKSDNIESSWDDITGSLAGWSESGNVLGSAFGQLYLYSPLLGILRSSNLGESWISLPEYLGGDVNSFIQHGSYVFAATTNGVFRSSNLGNNWTAVNNGIDTLSININGIVTTGSELYCINGQKVFKSVNNGSDWFSIQNNLPEGYIYAITVCDGNIYTARLKDGVYLSADGGAVWSLIADGLINNYTGTLASNSRYIFAGTLAYKLAAHESGVYRLDTGIIVSVPGTKKIPINYSLYQNYPNPFNPVTKIKFSLPLPSKGGVMDVKLIVFDVLGREVAVLFSSPLGRIGGATYEVEWDGSNYPSGVYFYKLEAGSYIETKKMVLVK